MVTPKRPRILRKHWREFISDYLSARQCLRALVMPMDIRRPLTELDIIMLEYCWEIELAVHVLLTKADKFKRGKALNILQAVSKDLQSQPQTTVQLFSAANKQGVDEARKHLTGYLHENVPA